MTTNTTLTALALVSAALAVAALAPNGSASARPLVSGFHANRVSISASGNGVGNSIVVHALALRAAAGLKLSQAYTGHGPHKPPPPPSCYPRADCVGNGNHGSGGSAGGGYDVNENGNGASPGGYDIDHPPTVCLAARYCYQPQ
jgi:hypothetical protein